jgi:hypothetical protein
MKVMFYRQHVQGGRNSPLEAFFQRTVLHFPATSRTTVVQALNPVWKEAFGPVSKEARP